MGYKRKPDYSYYLAHFTRDKVCVNENNCLSEDYQELSARDKLISILRNRTIYSSTMPWTGSKAVCFTECPWRSLIVHTQNYSSYGLGFTKKFIFGRHGGPVFYMRVEQFIKHRNQKFSNLDTNMQFLITPFQPIYAPSRLERLRKKPVDYTHEREWRVPEDLHFEYKDVKFVVVKSNDDFLSFPLDLRNEIGEEKFLIMDGYKTIELLWPDNIALGGER